MKPFLVVIVTMFTTLSTFASASEGKYSAAIAKVPNGFVQRDLYSYYYEMDYTRRIFSKSSNDRLPEAMVKCVDHGGSLYYKLAEYQKRAPKDGVFISPEQKAVLAKMNRHIEAMFDGCAQYNQKVKEVMFKIGANYTLDSANALFGRKDISLVVVENVGWLLLNADNIDRTLIAYANKALREFKALEAVTDELWKIYAFDR